MCACLQCFVGDEAVAWLVQSGKCRDKLEAVIIGNMMLKEGFFHHVLVSVRLLSALQYCHCSVLSKAIASNATQCYRLLADTQLYR